jgi:hypothetical protein
MILAKVRAPTSVESATKASVFLTSDRIPSDPSEIRPEIFNKPAVATARVFSSARASSLPSAAKGHPRERSSLCFTER